MHSLGKVFRSSDGVTAKGSKESHTMVSPPPADPMPKDVCCSNWYLLLHYIENASNLQSGLKGEAAVQKVLSGLIDNPKFLIQDPKHPNKSYPVEQRHLSDTRYWHSVEFANRLLTNAAEVIGGHRPIFRAGLTVSCKLFEMLLPKRFQLLRLFTPQSLATKLGDYYARFTRIKRPQVLEIRPGYARIAMIYNPEFKSQVISHMCDWTQGVIMGCCKFTGAEDLHGEELECIAHGNNDCIFEFRWVNPSARRRLFIFLHNIVDPDYIYKRDYDNLLLSDVNIRQEAIIKERTAELEASQKQLLAQERILTEQHIAGGMAHEIRNALGAADVRLKHYDFSEHIDKNIFRLKQILDKTEVLGAHNKNDQRTIVAAVRKLFEDQQNLQRNLSAIASAIQRGLKITGLVLDYAKLSPPALEVAVDVGAVIDDLVLSYGKQWADMGIDVKLSLASNLIVRGTEAQLHIVFQNLLLNARDAIVEKNSGFGWIQITNTMEDDNTIIHIRDNGVGISPTRQSKIFYPFFTTKPNRGIGLGLSTCQKIVRSYRGDIACTSTAGQGTVFSVRLTTVNNL